MKTKTSRRRRNQTNKSRVPDQDLIEREDRERTETELSDPREIQEEPEITPGMEPQIIAWDAAPASVGHKVAKTEPDDEANINKDLVEKGLPIPSKKMPG